MELDQFPVFYDALGILGADANLKRRSSVW
ncbi:hypothetical protein CEXT_518981, partial [Caerostris extrusa]